jgi:hypothetical protein
MAVQVEAPSIARGSSGPGGADGFVLVRHSDTGVVDAALKRIAECVRVESGDDVGVLRVAGGDQPTLF